MQRKAGQVNHREVIKLQTLRKIENVDEEKYSENGWNKKEIGFKKYWIKEDLEIDLLCNYLNSKHLYFFHAFLSGVFYGHPHKILIFYIFQNTLV